MDKQTTNYQLNMLVTMRKNHPCGGAVWKIVRVGADIKLQCATCMKYVNLSRDELKQRAKNIEESKQ